MSEPLIRTKLHPPRLSNRVIMRPRLLTQLRDQPERRLTLVVAPAGFGKTTIVTQWLAEQRQAEGGGAQVAWLSLDAEDSSLERCWRYLVAAIRRAFPASCAETTALLDAQQLPPPRYFADVLANDLAALPVPLVLVLDDYHQITSQDIHDALTRLVAYLPAQAHLVLISRTTVPWSLGRLRGLGQLAELRAAELRFTEVEARELLRAALASEPPAEVAELLCARTDGWAVGLQLASLSLRTAPDARALAQGIRGTSRHIADYLLDEVLGHQSESLQQTLLVLAVPERFCPELCAWLLDGQPLGAARATIAAIERQGLFLIALDDERTWYRYHHLVRDLLLFRLTEAIGGEGVSALYRRCSAWFAARGLIEEAVRHALQAGDHDLAAQLVEESYCELLERDEGMLHLALLLALLSEPVINSRPRLLLARAFDCFIRWDLSAMPAMIGRVVAWLGGSDPALDAEQGPDLRGDIALLQGILCFWAGDFARAAALTEEAYHLIPQTRVNIHALATMYCGEIAFHRGDGAGGLAFIREHLRQPGATTSTATTTLVIGLGYISLLDGKLEQVAHDTRQLIIDRTIGDRFLQSWGYYLLGRYHYECNELEAAERCFQLVSSFPYHTQERVYHDSLMGLARIALARGALDRAAEHARRGRAFAEERASTMLLDIATAFEAALALAQGDLLAAIWRAQSIKTAGYSGHAFWLEQARLCQAAVQIAEATPASLDEAAANLARYLAEAAAAHNVYWQLRVGGLLALAHKAQGDAEAALAVLGRAVGLAAQCGFIRSLVDCGPPLVALLRRLAPGDPNAAYITRLLAAFPARQGQEPDAVSAPPLQPRAAAPAPALLTEREREILTLLAERLTDQEIAARLGISITTVRTHTRNIYLKLEVENRRAAISRARELALLAPVERHA